MLKRVFDLTVSLCLIVLLLPLFVLLVCLVWISMGRPVFFRQARPGLGGVIFNFYKFRTMRLGDGPDEERMTRVGTLVRKLSLDELPQLWNVLKGEMSLVGPRPLLPEYLPLYSGEQFRRHEVRPGITGWAQVNGRNAISWERKFELDVWYVDHQSFLLDLKILALTVKKVFAREGISQAGMATTTRFMGSPARKEGASR